MILHARLRRFRDDEAGSVTLETMLVLPFLFIAYMSIYVFFDAFRADALNAKVAYTIGDLLSREANNPITPEYVNSLFEMQGQLTDTTDPRRLRVTAIRFNATANRYEVIWSSVRAAGWRAWSVRTTGSLEAIRSTRLPPMYDGEVSLLIETERRYSPLFRVGLGQVELNEFLVIRPRFAPQLCWSNNDNGPWTSGLVC